MTKLSGKTFSVNALYIESVESFPDTAISFTNGKKIVVRETEEEIIHSIKEFYRSVNVLGLRIDMEDKEYEE